MQANCVREIIYKSVKCFRGRGIKQITRRRLTLSGGPKPKRRSWKVKVGMRLISVSLSTESSISGKSSTLTSKRRLRRAGNKKVISLRIEKRSDWSLCQGLHDPFDFENLDMPKKRSTALWCYQRVKREKRYFHKGFNMYFKILKQTYEKRAYKMRYFNTAACGYVWFVPELISKKKCLS